MFTSHLLSIIFFPFSFQFFVKYQQGIDFFQKFSHLYTGNPLTDTLANSEHPDKMQYKRGSDMSAHVLLNTCILKKLWKRDKM